MVCIMGTGINEVSKSGGGRRYKDKTCKVTSEQVNKSVTAAVRTGEERKSGDTLLKHRTASDLTAIGPWTLIEHEKDDEEGEEDEEEKTVRALTISLPHSLFAGGADGPRAKLPSSSPLFQLRNRRALQIEHKPPSLASSTAIAKVSFAPNRSLPASDAGPLVLHRGLLEQVSPLPALHPIISVSTYSSGSCNL